MGLHEVCGANGWAGIDSPAKAGSPLRGTFAMLGVLRRYAPCRTKGSNQILPRHQIQRGPWGYTKFAVPTDGQGLIRLLKQAHPFGAPSLCSVSCGATRLVERRVRIKSCRATKYKGGHEAPFVFGGEAGIRTLGGLLTLNGFQDRRIQPLCHLSEGAVGYTN